MKALNKYKVLLLPEGREIDIMEGSTLMKAFKEAKIELGFPCGGNGKCGKCRLRVIEGTIQSSDTERRFLEEKEIEKGIHLACYTRVYSDASVEIFEEDPSHHKILLSNQHRQLHVHPHIRKEYVQVEKPSLMDHRSDWKRLCDSVMEKRKEEVKPIESNIYLLKKLPEAIRNAKYCLTAVTYEGELLDVEEGDTTHKMLGMAFDIGTTTVVGYLMDLNSGKELAIVSTLNPQTNYGADVITRTNYTMQQEDGVIILQSVILEAINNLIHEALEKVHADEEDLYVVTIVGNTCMHHLFLGLDPQYIGQSPYIPVTSELVVTKATDLDIHMNKAGKILVLPNIAGFVGADTVAVLLATEMDTSEDIKLMMDIGTNGEIVLGRKGRLFACSAAAGPAFEGAQITSGMRGAVGAIDHVYFGEDLFYSVIGEGKPRGICGSGLLDVVAGLLELGIIDTRGNFVSDEKVKNPKAEVFKKLVIEHEGNKAFLLVDEASTIHGRPILITQQDIRQLQLAKGAMATGVKILMEKYGISEDDIKEVLLAGAFGNYLNPHSACVVGLIPKELEGKITMVGNAAGTGSKIALLSREEYKRAANIASSVEYVELATYPNFTNIFAKSMYL